MGWKTRLTAQHDLSALGQGLADQLNVVPGHLRDAAVPPAALVQMRVLDPVQRPVRGIEAVVAKGGAAAVVDEDQRRPRLRHPVGALVDEGRVPEVSGHDLNGGCWLFFFFPEISRPYVSVV